MINEDLKQEINRQEPFFLLKAKKNGYICPCCNNGSGQDGDGIVKDNKGKYKCFKCGIYEDIIGLYMHKNNLKGNFTKAIDELVKIYTLNDKIPLKANYGDIEAIKHIDEFKKGNAKKIETQKQDKDYTKDFIRWAELNNYKYLKSRGISEEVQKKHKIGLDGNYCIIPLSPHSYSMRDIRAETEIKDNSPIKQARGKKDIFNFKELVQNIDSRKYKEIFVCEGAIDSMSLEELGYLSISTESTSNIHLLINKLKTLNNNYLKTIKFIIAFDSDNIGVAASKKLQEELTRIELKAYIFSFKGYKDINDYYNTSKSDLKGQISEFIANLDKNIKEDKKKQIKAFKSISDITSYISLLNRSNSFLTAKTGFKGLDAENKNLFGGLHEGLYVLGANSSLGKTTYILQLAEQIALNGTSVLFFSLEQSKNELMSKSISRQSFINAQYNSVDNINQCLTSAEVMYSSNCIKTDEKSTALFNAVEEHKKRFENTELYFEDNEQYATFNIIDIDKRIHDFINLHSRTPIVFIDYLQLIQCENIEKCYTEKQKTDNVITSLKLLSRKYKTCIFVISSLNRESYNSEVNLSSFKESGLIEYSSDVLFGLQYSFMDNGIQNKKTQDVIQKKTHEEIKKQQNGEPIEITLKCLKNRNGNKFDVKYQVLHAYNYFNEYNEDGKEWTRTLITPFKNNTNTITL